MKTSETIAALAEALCAFQAEMGSVPKTATNPFFKSKYADLATCVQTAMPVHTKHGLSVSQDPSTDEEGRPTLITTLMHTSGEWKESEAVLYLTKEDPQAQGSAITYMRRYAYCAVLGIVADDDDDAEAATDRKTQTWASESSVADAFPGATEEKPRHSSAQTLTPAQLKALESIHKARKTDFQAMSIARWGKSPEKLIKQEASRWLDELNGKVAAPVADENGEVF